MSVDGNVFSAVSAVQPTSDAGRFRAQLHPDWTIAGKPNGGYLLAVAARAAVGAGAHPHPIAASAHYLRAPAPGPVTLNVEVLGRGRTTSQVQVRLIQDDRLCLVALITSAELPVGSAAHWDELTPERPPQPARQFRLPNRSDTGFPIAIMDRIDLAIDARAYPAPSHEAHAGVEFDGRPGELRGTLALLGDEDFDPFSLLFASDAMPPATIGIEQTGWVPTMELTAYVRALPAPGPLRLLQRAHLIDAQRVDEACWVWDSAGRVVAQATQLAGIRLG